MNSKKEFDVVGLFGVNGVGVSGCSEELLDYISLQFKVTGYTKISSEEKFLKFSTYNDYFWTSDVPFINTQGTKLLPLKEFEDAVGYTEYKLNLEKSEMTDWSKVEVVTEEMLIAGVHVTDKYNTLNLVAEGTFGKYLIDMNAPRYGSAIMSSSETKAVYTIKSHFYFGMDSTEQEETLTKIWPVEKQLSEQEIQINELAEIIKDAQSKIELLQEGIE